MEEGKKTDVQPVEVDAVQLKADLEAKTAEVNQLKSEKDNAVAELIELRKKKSGVSEEEYNKALEQIATLTKQLTEKEEADKQAAKLKSDAALAAAASASEVVTPPPSTSPTQLSPAQEALRKEKGWTLEKYLKMKEKYPDIVL